MTEKFKGFTPPQESERTVEIEGKLQGLLETIPGVLNVHGCSSGDFKVNFNHESDLPDHPTYSYNLEYIPDEETLCAHALGLPYDLPTAVKEALDNKFPESSYRHQEGPGKGGFHLWVGIKEKSI